MTPPHTVLGSSASAPQIGAGSRPMSADVGGKTVKPLRPRAESASRSMRAARAPNEDLSECAVCRRVMQMFLQSSTVGKTPFAKLVRDDFLPDAGPILPSGVAASSVCRFHSLEKRRLDILLHIYRGKEKGQRYEALYDEVGRLDKNGQSEERAYFRRVTARYEAKHVTSVESVKLSLLEESDRLISFWGAQVEDMDAEIESAISSLEGKHVDEMQRHFAKLAAEAEKSKPHYTGTLLQLMETEPKLWGARRFNDAQRVADAGKTLEAAQRYGHDLTVERRTQRKIAHKLCEQARLMDAVVEKMKQHRRQQVVAKQADRDRLQSRVRLALTKLAREQRDELRRFSAFLSVQVSRMRNVIANAKPMDSGKGDRHPLYETKIWPTYSAGPNVIPQDYLDVPESTVEVFVQYIWPQRSSSLTKSPSGTGQRPASAGSVKSPYNNPRTLTGRRSREKSENLRSQMCDFCGGKIKNLCLLPGEEDQTTRLLLAVNPYDTAVLTTTGEQALHPPQVQGGAPKLPDLAAITRGKTALGYFCTWQCARQWNQKHSPAFVRSRRELVIDLLSTKPGAGQQAPFLAPVTLLEEAPPHAA